MSDDKKIIFSLQGVSKIYPPQKQVLKDIYLSFFYGAKIGVIGLNGSVNLAIAIRSFVSKQNKLYYQAGAGIVIHSNEDSELQEVNNKLAALKKALILAEKI